MIWYSAEEFVPFGDGWVIARCINSDGVDFIYQAIFSPLDGWQFWDEEYWPEGRRQDEGFKVTHWAEIPTAGDMYEEF